MFSLGSPSYPVRVAIIGAGPAGFYAAERFLRQSDLCVEVDVFEKLPTPYGLVRAGVAPDHEKIKNVTRVFDKTAANESFRYFGNVEYGVDIDLGNLEAQYHQVYFSTGASVDRQLNILGENLPRSHSATEFVAWYNGHPDYRDLEFDLSQESVAIVGMGNVAIDVARILCKTIEELATTDIADYALEALAESHVKTVTLLGRRGPAQAAFTLPEIREMGTLSDASAEVIQEEVVLDVLSATDLAENPERATQKKLEVISSFVGGSKTDASRSCLFRFLVSPTEIIEGEDGGVASIRLVRNRLERGNGRLRSVATDENLELSAGLLFRSVGYRGVAIPDIPFHEEWGVVRNTEGRVMDDSGNQVTGCYVGGWIKRGPTGVIGTNKQDAFQTVDHMLEDLKTGSHFHPESPSADASLAMVSAHQPRWISYAEWEKINVAEKIAGQTSGRPRIKLTSIEDMLLAAGR